MQFWRFEKSTLWQSNSQVCSLNSTVWVLLKQENQGEGSICGPAVEESI